MMEAIKEIEKLLKKWKDREVYSREEALIGSEATAISVQRGLNLALDVLKKEAVK